MRKYKSEKVQYCSVILMWLERSPKTTIQYIHYISETLEAHCLASEMGLSFGEGDKALGFLFKSILIQ